MPAAEHLHTRRGASGSDALQQPIGGERYGAYRRVQTSTSSPPELVLLLYDALAADLQRAELDLQVPEEHERAHQRLVRAQEIVLELLASLDVETGEIAQQLDRLYHYMYGRLVEANVGKSLEAVREVTRLVAPLRSAWSQAMQAGPASSNGSGRERMSG